jgi:hypothetical protein
MENTFFNLRIREIGVGGEVYRHPSGDLRIAGFKCSPPSQELLSDVERGGADAPPLEVKIVAASTVGEQVGEKTRLVVSIPTTYSGRRNVPLVELDLSENQLRMLHAALGCVVTMRQAERDADIAQAATSSPQPTPRAERPPHQTALPN